MLCSWVARMVTIVHFSDNIGSTAVPCLSSLPVQKASAMTGPWIWSKNHSSNWRYMCVWIGRCYVKVFLCLCPAQMTSYGPALRLCEPELLHHKGHLPAGRSFSFAEWKNRPAGQTILIWLWFLCVTFESVCSSGWHALTLGWFQ
jgi:hypothetical protein